MVYNQKIDGYNGGMKTSAAVMFVFHEGKLLILQRGATASWMPLKWNFPGGSVEHGESIIDAAVRETFEETDIQVEVENVKFHIFVSTPEFDVFFYICETDSSKVTLNFENVSFAWVDKDIAIKHYDLVPTAKEALKALKCNHKDELRKRAQTNEQLRQVLLDNEKEQVNVQS